jgi:DNA polymerase-3 subunit delta'
MFIGHKKQWEYLKRSIGNDRVAHAYLFYGPLNIGKKTVALEFVKLLNCHNSKVKSCGECDSCKNFEKEIYPNLLLVKPEPIESNKDDKGSNLAVRINQISNLKSRLSLSSSDSGYKAAIIDGADAMTYDAQGSLLKILEEPKGKTVIIIITEQADQLLSTIISRCQLIRFDLMRTEYIEESLKGNNVPKELAQEISWLSFGRPGLAIEYYKNPELAELQKKRIIDLLKLSKAPLITRFKYAEMLTKDTEAMYNSMDVWISYFRELLLENLGKDKNNFVLPAIGWSKNKIRNVIETIEKMRFVIKTTNTNPRLALEVLFMKI